MIYNSQVYSQRGASTYLTRSRTLRTSVLSHLFHPPSLPTNRPLILSVLLDSQSSYILLDNYITSGLASLVKIHCKYTVRDEL